MITINMMLLPRGSSIGRQEIVSGSIWSNHDNTRHCYNLWIRGKQVVGSVPKTCSGHRNPLTLLSKIIEEIQS